jgi:type IV pilus assembly protein PilQ
MKFMRACACIAALMGGIPYASAQVVEPAAAVKSNVIESFSVSKSGGGTVLRIGLQQALTTLPSSFSIANPARIVFYFPATTNGLGYGNKNVNDGGLRSFNLVEAGGRSRLVLNLDKSSRYETRTEGKLLFISLLEEGGGGAAAGPVVQHFAAGTQTGGHGVRDIQFRRSKDGAGVIVVDLSAPDMGIDVRQKGSSLQVSFKNAHLPDALRRRMDVVDFATPVTAVNAKAAGGDVSLEIVPKGLWEHTAFQSDNQFIVEVRPVKEDPNKLFQGSRTGYQGEAISLNFQNIPLRELLHVFADITNFNIVISDSVAGNVSLRLNDVPWDQALEIVLQQKNLAMRKNGNVVWIAPADELAAKEKSTLESKQQIAELEPLRTERFVLNYHQAEEIQVMIAGGATDPSKPSTQGSFLSSRGTVAVDKRTNTLFITDAPAALDRIRDLISALDRPARQVLIEARIVEAEDSFSSSIGMRLGTTDHRGGSSGHRILGDGDTRFSIGNSYAQNSVNTGQGSINIPLDVVKDGSNVNLPASSLGGATPSQFSFSLFNSAKTMFLNLELSALEFDGRGKVVSSPRVVTADKVAAVIKHGTQIPYLVASASGATTIAYRDAVLSLETTPVITPDDPVRR